MVGIETFALSTDSGADKADPQQISMPTGVRGCVLEESKNSRT